MRFQVFGERCSGTNYLEKLLAANFGSACITWDFGWKHWYIDFNTHQERLWNADDTAFIVVVRNFEDWVRSFFKQPHHLINKPLTMRQFLTQEIKSTAGQQLETDDNVFVLRKNKIKNFLRLELEVSHFHLVRYEDLIRDPEAFIRNLATTYTLALQNGVFCPVRTYKGLGARPYVPRVYANFTREERGIITAHLDVAAEALVGYHVIA